MKTRSTLTAVILATIGFASTVTAALPDPGVTIVPGRTALLITDPQNDSLSPKGATWGVVSKSVADNNTVENIDSLFKAAKVNLVLQLRTRGIDKVILGGMSANLCTESHMCELMEQGFEVAVVSDATAAAIVEEGNGYESALVNFRFIANTVWTTEDAVKKINGSK